MIRTIKGLYRALEALLSNISPICIKCQRLCLYDDCCGYIWLLPEEAGYLYSQGVEVVTINDSVTFINSFTDKDRHISVEQFKPPCPLCKAKKCSIHGMRPLVCRMYPLGISLEGGIMHLVLYLDCLFADKKARDITFQRRTKALFNNIDPNLLDRLITHYRKVLDLSKFPQGRNRVSLITPLENTERR